MSLESYESIYANALKIYESYINNVPCSLLVPIILRFELTELANTASISRAGVILATATVVGIAPEILVVWLVAGGVQYFWLDTARQKKVSTVQQLELQTSNLRNVLQQLSEEAGSIVSFVTNYGLAVYYSSVDSLSMIKARLTDILRQALRRLSYLQQQICMFMDFLIKIQTMIKITTERRDWVFKPGQTKKERIEVWQDTSLKQV
jgi:hypothetical protein